MMIPPKVEELLKQLEPAIRKAFLEALEQVRSAAQLKAVIGHLEDGNVEAAITALRIDARFFAPLDRALSEAFYQGGITALAALPRLTDPFPEGASSSPSTRALPRPSNGSGNDPQR